jgi:hypothetical protein
MDLADDIGKFLVTEIPCNGRTRADPQHNKQGKQNSHDAPQSRRHYIDVQSICNER